jgi:hypothetical protein
LRDGRRGHRHAGRAAMCCVSSSGPPSLFVFGRPVAAAACKT